MFVHMPSNPNIQPYPPQPVYYGPMYPPPQPVFDPMYPPPPPPPGYQNYTGYPPPLPNNIPP